MMRARARRRRLHPPRETKHARREREWGRMAYAHTWPCDVVAAYAVEFGLVDFDKLGPCDGRREYMHLHLEEGAGRRAPDRQGAIGCEGHHNDIDGRSGRRARAWYVALGRDGQLRLRHRLVDRQCARWDALSFEEQVAWDARRGRPF
jgi:hypothetical protein